MYTISEDNKEFLNNAVLDVYDYIRERDGLWYEQPRTDEKDTYELTELLSECLVILDDMNNYKGKLRMNDIKDTTAEAPKVTACEPVTKVLAKVTDEQKEEVATKLVAEATNDDNKDIEDIIA